MMNFILVFIISWMWLLGIMLATTKIIDVTNLVVSAILALACAIAAQIFIIPHRYK